MEVTAKRKWKSKCIKFESGSVIHDVRSKEPKRVYQLRGFGGYYTVYFDPASGEMVEVEFSEGAVRAVKELLGRYDSGDASWESEEIMLDGVPVILDKGKRVWWRRLLRRKK